MARGVNRVTLLGNMGRDPEIRYMPSGGAVANVAIATSQAWKDKKTGEQQERTEWHNIVFFNRLAEIVGEYLTKGSQIYIEGALRTRKYTDKNGVERYTTEIVASELQMLGGGTKNSGGSEGGNKSPGQGAGTPQQAVNNSNTPPDDFGVPDFDQFDDDIPF